MPRLCCVALLAVGCGSSPPGATSGDVRLLVEPDAVAPGDSVELVLENGSSGTVGYNLCTSGLERRSDGGWTPVPSDRVCTMELRTLPPGEEARYRLGIPPGLSAGEYRYRTNLERIDGGGRDSVVSEGFRVGG